MQRLAITLGATSLLTLGGCQKVEDMAAGGPTHHGRYEAVGVYSPGRMWAQLVRATSPANAAAATLKDDEEVIVVLDTKTGELRRCGNLSGYCLAMNPWAKAATPAQQAPVALIKHAEQLDAEAEAARQQAEAQAKAKSSHRSEVTLKLTPKP